MTLRNLIWLDMNLAYLDLWRGLELPDRLPKPANYNRKPLRVWMP